MAKAKQTRVAGDKRRTKPRYVHQFLVVLSETDPLVWRRIQVPAGYTFWDLHVAIQDAMGWFDMHLHQFRLMDAAEQTAVEIGIPTDDEPLERHVDPGWEVPLSRFFDQPGPQPLPARYDYDFGDDWQHVIVHEGLMPAMATVTYPRCLGGERRCPPEDCGGPHGFAELLTAIADPRHPEHRSMLEWVGGDYDPDEFDADAVTFDDPRWRWRRAFGKSSEAN